MKEITIDGVEYTLTPKVSQEPKVVQRFIDVEVYPEDAPEGMAWEEAAAWCNQLGDGWRLPDRQEILAMCEQREIIGDFGSYFYWSSSEENSYYAWKQCFTNGLHNYGYKHLDYRVRAVRDREAGE